MGQGSHLFYVPVLFRVGQHFNAGFLELFIKAGVDAGLCGVGMKLPGEQDKKGMHQLVNLLGIVFLFSDGFYIDFPEKFI